MTAPPDPIRVFLVGEGANELGSRAGHLAYQNDERPGVLHTLLARVQPTGWQVGGARVWQSIRKLRTGRAPHADTHNVLGAVLDAKEAGCEVLAFSRDLDKDPPRREAIDEGLRRVPSTSKDGAAMARIAEEASLDGVPEDAASLRYWLDEAQRILPRAVAERAGGAA